ncbi:MAG: alpha-N-arabinofuranosidase, partial [Sphingobacteriales bacterium]
MIRFIPLIFLSVFLRTSTYGQQDQPHYLFDSLYFADPAVHVLDGKIYIYPSHDISTDVKDGAGGGHYNMKDYHV